MGSPISVVIAELVMYLIEYDIFDNATCNILLWKRYVDDYFAIIPTSAVKQMLAYINSLTGTYSSLVKWKKMEPSAV